MSKQIRVLSLDGGGIRGVSALLVLEAIMEKVRDRDQLPETPLPCDYFDLIGGTSTGGIIAIMLGRLGMSVEQCLKAYKNMARLAFTPKTGLRFPAHPSGSFSATAFEKAIKRVVEDRCESSEELFRDPSCCKTIVLAITKANVDASPTLFRSFDTNDSLRDCTIWQVARATSAATTFFKPIKCGREGIEFIDAGFGYNNPCEVLLGEAQLTFPNHELALVLSIGTGLAGVISIKDSRRSILKALKKMASSSGQVADRLDRSYADRSIYYRFNVTRGLEDVGLSDWDETSTVSAHTFNYLKKEDRRICECSDTLREVIVADPGPLIETVEKYINQAYEDLKGRQQEMEEQGVDLETFDWFTKVTEYVSWSSSKSTTLLWHEGEWESGKTTLLQALLGKIIDYRDGRQDVAFVFCAKSVTAGQTAPPVSHIEILRSVIGQILGRYQDEIARIQAGINQWNKSKVKTGKLKRLILESYFSSTDIMPTELWALLWLVLTTIRVQMHIIIDGIDLLNAKDRSDFLKELLELKDHLQLKPGQATRFLITSSPDDDTRKTLKGIPVIDTNVERKHCLNSLFFSELHARRDRVSDAQDNTNKWIWNHHSYKRWLEDESSILWIQGKPGSGKSTLAKTIQKTLFSKSEESARSQTEREQMLDSIVVDFFYSTRGGSMETSHKLMLQSLLYQILEQEPSLFELFQGPFRRLRGKSTGDMQWPQADLEKVFLSLALDKTGSSNMPYRKLYFVVDAMDESEDQDENGRRRIDTLSLLSCLCSKRGKNIIKVILLSRPANEIEREFRRFHHIKLQEENQQDIKKVVNAGLHLIWESMNYSDEASNSCTFGKERDLVKSYLLENAEGVILWVVLMIRELARYFRRGYHSIGEIKKKLASLPMDLERFYEEIVDRMRKALDGEGLEKVRFMLVWASFAKRPLTIEEFRDSIAISASSETKPSRNFLHDNRIRVDNDWEPMRRAIVDMSGCFLEVARPNSGISVEGSGIPTVSGTDIVQFLHQTAKDFLVHNKCAGPLRLDQERGERLIAIASLKYLMTFLPMKDLQDKAIQLWNQEDYSMFVKHLQDAPLLSYVLCFLPQYVNNLRVDRVCSTLSEFLLQLHSQEVGHAWGFLKLWCYQEHLAPKALRGKMITMEPFMTKCLMTASEAGQAGVVKSILDARADIGARDASGRTALELASSCGHEAVVKLLLEKGATTKYGGESGQRALDWAVEKGHRGVIKLLLEGAGDIEARGINGRTALHRAAGDGREAVVNLLLESGADIETRDDHEWAALHIASSNGHEAVVKLLLEKGADAESRTRYGWMALHIASSRGHGEVVKLMLKKGADIGAKGDNGWTALHGASYSGREPVVNLLLKNGADIKAKGGDGETALHLAAWDGRESVAKLLLQNGADAKIKDNTGKTALDRATEHGHDTLAKLLSKPDPLHSEAHSTQDFIQRSPHFESRTQPKPLDRWVL